MTKTDLATAVLRKMRVLPRGGAVNTEDKNIVDGHYDRYLESMQDEGVADWGADDDIPDNVAEFVIILVAALCCDDFQIEEGRTRRLQQDAFGPDSAPRYSAITQLKRYATPDYVPASTAVTNY